MPPRPPGWALLVSVSARGMDWPGVLGATGLALGVASLAAVLPATADAVLGTAAVLVLACGLAAVLDDDTSGATAPAPTSPRRRLAARTAIAVPVLAAGLGGVVLLLAVVGTGSSRDILGTWAALTVLAVAVGAVGVRGRRDLPGPVAAAAVLAPGAVLVPLLPTAVLTVPVWDSTPERILLAVVLSGAVVLAATRDPVDPPIGRSVRRPGSGSRALPGSGGRGDRSAGGLRR